MDEFFLYFSVLNIWDGTSIEDSSFYRRSIALVSKDADYRDF